MFLPAGLEELFEMVRFERTDLAYDIWLDEKKKLSDEDFRNPNIGLMDILSDEIAPKNH